MRISILLYVLLLSSVVELSAQALSKEESADLAKQLIEQRQEQSIEKFGTEWEAKILLNGEYKMPFDYKVFGAKPADGRALYISMHGGGGTAARVNDQQWHNQKSLYKPHEGVYFAPRSPTDTWNMWHQSYMDGFIEKIIELAVINEGVNPNKVYIMGYSAGGDGTFQLAPRLADLWAGAAMSAGHPGDAQLESLRNLPFALYMGGQDGAYNRNGLAREWKVKHDSIAMTDEGAYIHDIKIFEQYSHWMQREDSVSMSWLPQFVRNPIPDKVVWVQDNILRDKFYWLESCGDGKTRGAKIVASYSEGRVDIMESTVDTFIIGLNDEMMDLDKKISIYYQGQRIFKGKVVRSENNIRGDVAAMRDVDLIFPARLRVDGGVSVTVIE